VESLLSVQRLLASRVCGSFRGVVANFACIFKLNIILAIKSIIGQKKLINSAMKVGIARHLLLSISTN